MAKRKLEDIDFNCAICIDTLIEPVSLECGHTLCMNCATRMNVKMCPHCRTRFKMERVKKNVLLSSILESLHGKQYRNRCKDLETIKQYYRSERFDTLCDLVLDAINEGKKLFDDDEEPTFCATLEDVEQHVKNAELDSEFKFTSDEIKACILEQLRDKHIIQIKNFYIVNGEDWIVDKISSLNKHLSNEDMFFMLSPLIKCYISGDAGSIMKRRRQETVKFRIDQGYVEDNIVELIKSKKIEL